MSDFWVFGYGSLMWRPDFPHLESVPARLFGAHRSLCVYSWVHRGSRDRPGLVLGLDRGGSCRGVAFRVAPADIEPVTAYLREREQVTRIYLERHRPVVLERPDRPLVTALAFLVDRTHPQYAGVLPAEEVLAVVRGAHGQSGPNPDYVINTQRHLAELGIADRRLEWLAGALRGGATGPAGQAASATTAGPRSATARSRSAASRARR
jgi:cation transport protein ChaC